jgi:uncharacterized iron-regulated protein
MPSPAALIALLLPMTAAIAVATSLSLSTGTTGAQMLPPRDADACMRAGHWLAAGPGMAGEPGPGFQPRPATDVIATAARRQVVLLGEHHDNADHHRWQLQVLAALHAQRPDMVIGFEMFPRRVQPVLDRWVAGELSEAEFLRLSDWSRVWGFDPQLYLPMFHFARLNRIPMIALNVERTLVRQVGAGGWDSVPEAQREGVTRPAAPAAAYAARLRETFEMHMPRAAGSQPGSQPGSAHGSAPIADADARFNRFLEAQLTWDRAMAEALARRARAPSAPLVVGVMGSGHLQFGQGVPEQLRALGVPDTYTMIPFDLAAGETCAKPPATLAHAVFAVPTSRTPPTGPRLGVSLGMVDSQVRIEKVGADSLAERSGLRAGDRVQRVAGTGVRNAEDLTAAIREQPPGTVLPIVVQRDGRELEVLVRFPPRAP